MLLTVGMAVYRDFSGVFFTVQALRLYHPHVEILVVDNARQPCDQTRGVVLAAGGTYHHRPDLAGTSQSRDALFRLARTDWVCVVDAHVLFLPGAVQALIDYASADPGGIDIIQGPLVFDDLRTVMTHWRSEAPPAMWGVWDRAWRCPDGHVMTPLPRPNSHLTDAADFHGPSDCPRCRRVVDGRPWPPFDDMFADGYVPADLVDEPFEIPMQGLGQFMMRREAWPGFHPAFRGFGGEEGYIHGKVRRRGGRAICLPRAGWLHRFRGPSDPAPYRNSVEDHTTNLIIGHRELGVDAAVQLWQHFGSRLTPNGAWDRAVEEARRVQPFFGKPERLRILGVWYTNNAAPEPLLLSSLETIHAARRATRHEVVLIVSAHRDFVSRPHGPSLISGHTSSGHARILDQMQQCVDEARERGWEWDVVCCLEHDVLYPPEYFDRVAEAFLSDPGADAVSNLDYEGLGATGWLAVKERHEPMHQLSFRRDYFLANLERARSDCERQGWALLEPQDDRSRWIRLPPLGYRPAVHVNHRNRFTSHGEVCYHADSGGRTFHSFWGDFRDWWPDEPDAAAAASPPAPTVTTCKPCSAPVQGPLNLEAEYRKQLEASTDLHEHMPLLKDMASRCDHVTELSCWNNGALTALAAGRPKVLVSCCPGVKPEWSHWHQGRLTMGENTIFTSKQEDPRTADLEPTDLLFVDAIHEAEAVYLELSKHAPLVSHWIVLHDTVIHGEVGSDGGPGILVGVRRYLREHPEWTVVEHRTNNYGLTVLSRRPEDKRKLPGLAEQAWNYGKALSLHTLQGAKAASLEEVERRLDVCALCEHRTDNRCGVCGCHLDRTADGGEGKALWAESECPLGRWAAPVV